MGQADCAGEGRRADSARIGTSCESSWGETWKMMSSRQASMPLANSGSNRASIRILLLDGSAEARTHLACILGGPPHLEIVGEAENAVGALAQAARTRPQVVVMDVQLPDGSGLQALGELRQSKIHVLVLTT